MERIARAIPLLGDSSRQGFHLTKVAKTITETKQVAARRAGATCGVVLVDGSFWRTKWWAILGSNQ